jgi:hypothetical protein
VRDSGIDGLFAFSLVSASWPSRRTSSTENVNPPDKSRKANAPTTNIAVSDISPQRYCLSEVVSCREDRGNPYAHEDASFLSGAHANAKPKGYREKKRQKSCRKDHPISFG